MARFYHFPSLGEGKAPDRIRCQRIPARRPHPEGLPPLRAATPSDHKTHIKTSARTTESKGALNACQRKTVDRAVFAFILRCSGICPIMMP